MGKKIVILYPNAFVNELFRIVGIPQFATIIERSE